MSPANTVDDCTASDLTAADAVLLNQSDLDTFVDAVGGPDAIPGDVTVFTEDDFTRGKVEFNLIVFDNGEYGIATQLHDPFTPDDTLLDLRGDVDGSFAEYIMGLM